jgi:hypothetical protein
VQADSADRVGAVRHFSRDIPVKNGTLRRPQACGLHAFFEPDSRSGAKSQRFNRRNDQLRSSHPI